MRRKFNLLLVDIQFDVRKCKFSLNNSSLDTGCIFAYFCGLHKKSFPYNFVAPTFDSSYVALFINFAFEIKITNVFRYRCFVKKSSSPQGFYFQIGDRRSVKSRTKKVYEAYCKFKKIYFISVNKVETKRQKCNTSRRYFIFQKMYKIT